MKIVVKHATSPSKESSGVKNQTVLENTLAIVSRKKKNKNKKKKKTAPGGGDDQLLVDSINGFACECIACEIAKNESHNGDKKSVLRSSGAFSPYFKKAYSSG